MYIWMYSFCLYEWMYVALKNFKFFKLTFNIYTVEDMAASGAKFDAVCSLEVITK